MQRKGAQRPLKERQREERENLILQTAEEVLLEKGFHDTSMDEIATKVGIAKGTLYLHFASKEDLALALLEQELKNFRQIIEQSEMMTGRAQEKLEFLLHTMFLGLIGRRARLLSTFYNSPDMHFIMRAQKSDTIGVIKSSISSLLEDGKREGAFDSALPTEIMLGAFMSLFNPRAYRFLVLDGVITSEDFLRYVSTIYFRGIAAPNL